ncbi:MAG: radical SAM protein [Thermoplasmata archaeon]|nr:MAG: radical SAM protein [Thermoplasmata archaeon]
MKVLLMVPLTSLMKNHPDIPDLGLGYLATGVRKEGFEVDILGWNHHLRIERFREYLRITQPSVVGIKVFTYNINAAVETVSIIKSVNSCIVTVIGGPHPSANNPTETMDDFNEVDFAFRGDAEIGFPSLVKELSKKGSDHQDNALDQAALREIPGLIWRKNGTVHANPPHFPDDLDTLGLPSWDLIDPKDYHPYRIDESDTQGHVAPIMTTRGCPLSCTYCSVNLVNGRVIRRRSVGSVIEEMSLLHNRYNVRQIFIMDTNFLSDKEYVKELCNAIIEKGLHIKWDCICETLKRSFYDDEILSLMYRAGCRKIIMGIESGSNKILRVIKKEWNKEQFSDLVGLIKSHAIQVHGYFMYGFPYETAKDMKDTRDFAFTVDFDRRFFNVCYPLPGTEIYEFLKRKYRVEKLDWRKFTVERSPYPIGDVSSREIIKFLRRTELRNLLHSSTIYKDFHKKEFLSNFAKIVLKLVLIYLFQYSRQIRQC